MEEQRDLEAERQELLKQIEAALPDDVRAVVQASSQHSLAPKVIVSTNEVGSVYADQG
jgi:hypothetical protein